LAAADITVVASGVSIALAVFAIWQASMFYRWSNEASQESRRSADAIRESVKTLEAIFNRLYSDTFGMMRDTVTDMRRHMWPASPDVGGTTSQAALDAEKRVSESIAEVKEEMQAELRSLVFERMGDAGRDTTLQSSLDSVVDKAIDGSREAATEAVRSIIRDRLLSSLAEQRRNGQAVVTADALLGPLFAQFEPEMVHEALAELRKQGDVDWEDDGWVEGPDVPIRVLRAPPY
jgi:gas vesicle protein